MSDPSGKVDPSALAEETQNVATLPKLRSACRGLRAYLVGGVVRDVLLGDGAGVADIDVAVEGEVGPIAASLGTDAVEHDRFGTARVIVDGITIDLARTRTETYPAPGALPEVAPADLAQDLARRDFTVNAMAIPLDGQPELIDPLGGLEDLQAGLLRVIHDGSFRDDPTRALRAARYAARLAFRLEERTAELLAATDLGTVSVDRVRAELHLIAAERSAGHALRMAAEWGLIEIEPDRIHAAAQAAGLASRPRWASAPREPAVLLAAGLTGDRGAAASALAALTPERPSEAVRAAAGHPPEELLAARALGAEWLDAYVDRWAGVTLEIDGGDLLAAGVPEGPAVGAGLEAALTAKLDRGVEGAAEELRLAVEAAGKSG